MNAISNNPKGRVIPLTPAGAAWSQREYVACLALGIQFAAHRHGPLRQVFHYAFPDDIGCTSVVVDVAGPLGWIDHDFTVSPDWLQRCRAAMAQAPDFARRPVPRPVEAPAAPAQSSTAASNAAIADRIAKAAGAAIAAAHPFGYRSADREP